MKIFRAVIEYNNNDTNEWETWNTKTSKWYTNKALAEQHLVLLEQFRDFLKDHYVNSYNFCCKDPYIEEQNIAEEFTPMQLNFMGKEFKGFEYIPYNGPYSINSQKLRLSSFPNPSWYIEITIGEENFEISFSIYNDNPKAFYCGKSEQNNSNFFKYNPEVREELLSLVKNYAESISPYFLKYREESDALDTWDEYDFEDPRREEGWEAQRVNEVQNIERLLKNTHLVLSEDTISGIKSEIDECEEGGRRGDSPKYKESLIKLLSYGSYKPTQYPVEEYSDLAIKLREALNM